MIRFARILPRLGALWLALLIACADSEHASTDDGSSPPTTVWPECLAGEEPTRWMGETTFRLGDPGEAAIGICESGAAVRVQIRLDLILVPNEIETDRIDYQSFYFADCFDEEGEHRRSADNYPLGEEGTATLLSGDPTATLENLHLLPSGLPTVWRILPDSCRGESDSFLRLEGEGGVFLEWSRR